MEGTHERQLERQLERVRRRVRGLAFAYGLGSVVVALAACAVFVVAADYLLNLPAFPRLVLALGALIILGTVAWLHLIRPLMSRLTLSDIAGRVEQAFPQFDDRLRSGVTFAAATTDDRESARMRERTREEAVRLASTLDLGRAVDVRPARDRSMVGVGALLALLAFAFVTPAEYRSAAASRLLSPFAGVAWPKRTQIVASAELPARVAAGQRLPVQVRLARGDRPSARATVFYQYGEGPVRSELMSRSADGTFSASLDARVGGAGTDDAPGSMKVWVRAGDDERTFAPVTVVPRLALRKVLAEITPPDYARVASSGATAGTFDLTKGPAGVVEGSRVGLRLTFNKPLAAPPELVPVGAEPAVLTPASASIDGASAVIEVLPERTARFTLRGRDVDGFDSSSLTEYEIVVRPDQQPAIQIDLPRRSEDRTATAFVPLRGTAEDDFSVRDVTLHVKRLGDGREWKLPLVAAAAPQTDVSWQEANSAPDRTRMRLGFLWELSALQAADLKPGDVLEYYLSATDNYRRSTPGGVLEHPPATSSRLRITIVSQDELAARAAEELRAAGDQVARLRSAQQRTTTETQELADQTRDAEKLDDAQRSQARRLGEQQSAVASQSKSIAGKVSELMERLAENRLESRELASTAQDVRDTLDRAAEGPMKDASARLNESREAEKEPRNERLTQAQQNQRDSEKLLAQAMDRLSRLGSLRQTMENVRRLLGEQQELSRQTRELARNNLGKRPEDMSAADRKKLDELTDRQRELQKQTDKALTDMDRQAEETAKSDPSASESLRKAAETGRQQQVSPSQSRAASSMQQNQQTQAQAEQRRAEVGLQVMLEQLREAERNKLEELTRKLADLQEQIKLLVRRQAGHNLDNLGLRNMIAKTPAKQLEELLARAERPRDKAAGADLPSLSAGQELTERNTRSLSESAGDAQGAADAASTLSRAASRMERAAVLLRGNLLQPAYEPPQVEALAALVEAQTAIDEMRRKAEEERKEQQRETIRAKYQALRDEQDTLLKDTKRLQAVRARVGDAPDALPRTDAQRLLTLPPVQGALAERTEKIEEDLAGLGATVYVWANKDIVSTMRDARAGLADRKTDAGVQSLQQQAIDQLDAMIASLATKPREKEFEEGGGGGGGGGGQQQQGQKLPAEAELRLLKALQQAVNRTTKSQAAQAQPEKPALDQLGRRQGELRRLTGELLEKASRGEFKPGPEPARDVKLPEEAGAGGADDALDRELLGGPAHGEGADPDAAAILDRMGRSRQRLGDDADPGAITQRVQDRILKDLDDLIEKARQQQQQGQGSPQGNPQPGQQPGQPQPGGQQANNQGNASGANQPSPGGQGSQSETDRPGGQSPAAKGGDIRERASEWGALAPRQRQAVLEGQQDAVIEKYRALVDDYYRSLAEKSSPPPKR